MTCQARKNNLRHIVREVRITTDLPERCGINQINMPPHNFGKCILGICRGIAPEQFAMGRHIQIYKTHQNRKRTRKLDNLIRRLKAPNHARDAA